MMNAAMRYVWYDSPIGRLLVAGDEEGVRHVGLPQRDPSKEDEPRRSASPKSFEPPDDWRHDPAGLAHETAELDAYFAGELREFEMRCAPRGTDFQREVWAALAHIPYGETRGYGELARAIGRAPGASRAVGAANGANPIAIVLPCHRVIGANGRLVGYGGGLARKHLLLAHEQGEPVFASTGGNAAPDFRLRSSSAAREE